MTDEEQELECPFGITWEDVKALLPQHVELIYIDWQENLNNSFDKIEACIQQQDWSPLDEVTDDWFIEASGYSMDYIYGELKTELVDNFDIDEDQADEVIEEYRESIDEELYSRDKSTPIDDLLRNSNDIVFLYDVALDVSYCEEDGDDITEPLRQLRETLQINDRQYDTQLAKALFETQGWCTDVYIAFSSCDIDATSLMYVGDSNVIEFKNPHVVLANAYSESTWQEQFNGHIIQLALEPKRISVDNANKYSVTANMGSDWDWPSGTKVRLLEVNYLQIMLDIRAAYRERLEKGV